MNRYLRSSLLSIALSAACGPIKGVEPPRDYEDCFNQRDDDADGKIDCADVWCEGLCTEGAGNAWSEPPLGQLTVRESCTDGIDQDGDLLFDAADPDCWGALSRAGFSCTSGAGVVRTWAGDVASGAIRPLGPFGRTDPYVSSSAGTIGGNYGDAPIAGRLEGLSLRFLSFLEPGETASLSLRPFASSGAADRTVDPRVAVVVDGVRGAIELRLANRVVGKQFVAFGWHEVEVRAAGGELHLSIAPIDGDPAASESLRLAFDQETLPPSVLDVMISGGGVRTRSGFDDIRLELPSYHPCGQIVPMSGWSAANQCGEPYLDRGPRPASATTSRSLISAARLGQDAEVTCVVQSGTASTPRAWALSAGAPAHVSEASWNSYDLVAVAGAERAGSRGFAFALVDPDSDEVVVEWRSACDLAATAEASSTADLFTLIPPDERAIAVSLVADTVPTPQYARTCDLDVALSLFVVTEPRYGTAGAMSRRLHRIAVDRETLELTASTGALDFPIDTAGLPVISAPGCGDLVLTYPAPGTAERAARSYTVEADALVAGSRAWAPVEVLGDSTTGSPFDYLVTSSSIGSFDVGAIDSVVPITDALTASEYHASRLLWIYVANQQVGVTASDAPALDLETSRGFALCGAGRTDAAGAPCFTCATGSDVSCYDADVVASARIIPNAEGVVPEPRDGDGQGGIVEVVPDSGATWVVPERAGDFTLAMDIQGEFTLALSADPLTDVDDVYAADIIYVEASAGSLELVTQTQSPEAYESQRRSFPREPGWLHLELRRHDGGTGKALDLIVTARGTTCELARIEGLPDLGVAVSRVSVIATSALAGGGIPALVEGFSVSGSPGAGSASCGGTLVDTTTDPANCGACDAVCPASVACAASVCSCPSGEAICDSGCVDLLSARDHCGACGRGCGFGQVCVAGACVVGATTGESCDEPNFLVGPGPFSTTYDFAASGDDEPTLPRNFTPSAREVIYAFQAPADGFFTFAVESTTCAIDGTSLDTVLEVYEGNCDGTLVGVSDDSGNCLGSRFIAPVLAGRTYTVVVATYSPETTSGSVAINASFTGASTGDGRCGTPLVPVPNQSGGRFAGTYNLSSLVQAASASTCSAFDSERALYLDPRLLVESLGTVPTGAHLTLRASVAPTYLPVLPTVSVVNAGANCSAPSEAVCAEASGLNESAVIDLLRFRRSSDLPLIAATALDGAGASASGLLAFDLEVSLHPFDDCYGGTRTYTVPVDLGAPTWLDFGYELASSESLDVDLDYGACGGVQVREDAVVLVDVASPANLVLSAVRASDDAPVSAAFRLFNLGSLPSSETLNCADLTPSGSVCTSGASASYPVIPGRYAVALALPMSSAEAMRDVRLDIALMP